MKNIIITAFILCSFISCNNENYSKAIIGQWNLAQVKINGISYTLNTLSESQLTEFRIQLEHELDAAIEKEPDNWQEWKEKNPDLKKALRMCRIASNAIYNYQYSPDKLLFMEDKTFKLIKSTVGPDHSMRAEGTYELKGEKLICALRIRKEDTEESIFEIEKLDKTQLLLKMTFFKSNLILIFNKE